jgi:hypothetical protein
MSKSRKVLKKKTENNINTITDNIQYGVLEFNDPEFDAKLINLIKEFGVVVIKNVLSEDESSEHMNNIVTELETVSSFKRSDIKTWKPENLPQQVRSGMFHELICNTPTINKLRFDSRIIKIFTSYYSHMKDYSYDDIDMIVSNDGLNIKPGNVPPYDDGSDWAHLDQTGAIEDPYKCIQGQMVLSNTSASFRASPKSHLLFKEFVADSNTPTKVAGFLKFKPEMYFKMQKDLEAIGGSWQIKIPANKGDFIIWTSSTVHSATYQSKPEKPTKLDQWNGWRCVVFVCYRPRDEFTDVELRKKYTSYTQNRVTNHWGTTVFPSGFGRFNARNKNKYTTKVRTFIEDPSAVYNLPDMTLELTYEQAIIMGVEII